MDICSPRSCHTGTCSSFNKTLPPTGMLRCLLELRILVCGDTGQTQHDLPLPNDLSLFTLLIWRIDLHCDSRPSSLSLSLRHWDLRLEMKPLSSQSQQQLIQSLRAIGSE